MKITYYRELVGIEIPTRTEELYKDLKRFKTWSENNEIRLNWGGGI